MMTTMIFNFGMIFFVPQLFLIGLWTEVDPVMRTRGS